MKPPSLSSIPLKTYLAVGGALAVLAATGWIYETGRHHEAVVLKPKIEAATDNGVARGLEAQGAQDSTARTEQTLSAERRVQENTHAVIVETRAQPTRPLDPATAARLRAHDRVLCDERPALCAPDGPAAGGDAGDRGRVL